MINCFSAQKWHGIFLKHKHFTTLCMHPKIHFSAVFPLELDRKKYDLLISFSSEILFIRRMSRCSTSSSSARELRILDNDNINLQAYLSRYTTWKLHAFTHHVDTTFGWLRSIIMHLVSALKTDMHCWSAHSGVRNRTSNQLRSHTATICNMKMMYHRVHCKLSFHSARDVMFDSQYFFNHFLCTAETLMGKYIHTPTPFTMCRCSFFMMAKIEILFYCTRRGRFHLFRMTWYGAGKNELSNKIFQHFEHFEHNIHFIDRSVNVKNSTCTLYDIYFILFTYVSIFHVFIECIIGSVRRARTAVCRLYCNEYIHKYFFDVHYWQRTAMLSNH